ncbi:MAG: hypothetical protein QHJ34_02820 [bacterium]|jgi:hypothetical protein|nr:hypothetical protein [candidate division KSB1 bacterium]MDH7559152.1 hypothetical protein [bacterium]
MVRVGRELLVQAKAFLCWDRLPGLAVQLVEVDGPVSYFFAPQAERGAVVLFVPREQEHSEELYLLFHEAGHYLQYRELERQGHIAEYWRLVDLPLGGERLAFERDAWARGRELLQDFVRTHAPERPELLVGFDACAREKVASYGLTERAVRS